jgi:phage I-like protein
MARASTVPDGAMTTLLASHSTALPDTPPEWVHLIPAGTFRGRDGRGPYTLADPAAVVAAFAAEGRPLPIDYDHQLLKKHEMGTTAPASGWIVGMDARADGIWGRVEWTERGALAVCAREWRFLSPVFRFDAKTGAVLRLEHAGLVNNPNLELTAVAAAAPNGGSMDEFLKRLIAIFGMAEAATADTVIAHAQGMTAVAATHKADLAKIAASLKLDGTATADQIAAHAQGLSNSGLATGASEPDPAHFVPMAQFTAVTTELAQVKTRIAAGTAEQAVVAAMAEGKASPAMKDWALAYAAKDPAGFELWRKAAPVIVAPGASSAADKPPATAHATLSPADLAVCAQLGLAPDAFAKTSVGGA